MESRKPVPIAYRNTSGIISRLREVKFFKDSFGFLHMFNSDSNSDSSSDISKLMARISRVSSTLHN